MQVFRAARTRPRSPPQQETRPTLAGNLQSIENIPQFPRRDLQDNLLISLEVLHG